MACAFVNVKISNGDYMIKGIKVTGFPNSTEITKSWLKKELYYLYNTGKSIELK